MVARGRRGHSLRCIADMRCTVADLVQWHRSMCSMPGPSYRGKENLCDPTTLERDRIGNVFHITGERMGCQATVHGPVTIEPIPARLPRRNALDPCDAPEFDDFKNRFDNPMLRNQPKVTVHDSDCEALRSIKVWLSLHPSLRVEKIMVDTLLPGLPNGWRHRDGR